MLELVEFIDIVVSACLVYVLIRWLRDARARLALVGVSLVGAGYLLALAGGLALTARLLQAAFFISAVVLLLVFQEDLRRSFERLAIVVLRRERPAPEDAVVEVVARSAFALAEARHGALIVLPGHEPIDRHVEGGEALNGTVSEALLLSLFDPHSPGHDGAVILGAARVRRFAAHLPLSSAFEQLGPRGTRHAAALGLSERCDAVAVVVSEERGTVSVAQRGALRPIVSPAELAALLRTVSRTSRSVAAPTGREHPVRSSAGTILVAAAAGVVLWILLVPGSTVTGRTFTVPVEVRDLPAGYRLVSVRPPQVSVTISGVRRAMFFVQARNVHVRIDAILAQVGQRSFEISPESVKCPADVAVKAVEPDRVDLSLQVPGTSGADFGRALRRLTADR